MKLKASITTFTLLVGCASTDESSREMARRSGDIAIEEEVRTPKIASKIISTPQKKLKIWVQPRIDNGLLSEGHWIHMSVPGSWSESP